MLILGLNAYHGDSSAGLVEDGALVVAAEEERFTRIKHWAGFPTNAVRWCLDERKVRLADIDVVAVNRDPRANLLKKMAYVLRQRPELRLILDRLKNVKHVRSITDDLVSAFPGESFRGDLAKIEHHTCHLASAFLVSPFDEAVCVSVDGFGDFASASWGMVRGVSIDVEAQVLFPHSLGIFYQALTQYLGFGNYGDEYKVMGLAPYGKPTRLAEMRQIVRLLDDGRFELDLRYFRHTKEQVSYEWDGGSPKIGTIFSPELEGLLGAARRKGEPLEQRHWDVARSVQAMYEEAFFHLLRTLYRRHSMTRLVLAGGCAMNSVANGKVARETPFREVYVQSAAGDAGGAIGAAMTAACARGVRRNATWQMKHAYWGPQYAEGYVRAMLESAADRLPPAEFSLAWMLDDDRLCKRVAAEVAHGNVVGWFQGRMEWGPRALGNRSILCDPRRSDMKDILNLKIKRRESFRPFAPSILRERTGDWFEEDADVPFMMKVFQIREDKRAQIPAVTHVDGSGRLQTVFEETNPLYYRLIREFEALTGVPMVLNTSFNENEPVVCKPEEALDCFLRTKMDVLVLGRCVIERVA